MKQSKRIKRRTVALIARVVAAVLRLIPCRLVPGTGRILGGVGWLLARSSRRIATSQLRDVYPEASESWLRTVGRGLFNHLATSLIETVKLPQASREERMSRGTVEGLALFRDAYARGKGLLAVTGHIGNWEVLAAAFCDLGFPVNVVGRGNPNPWLEAMIRNLRVGYGAAVLDRDKDARAMLRSLRRGEVVALLVDQDTRVDGIFIPFLGRSAHTPIGHAKLAVRTGAPVVVLTINRLRGQRGHHVKVWEVIEPAVTNGRADQVQEICVRCNQILEKAIRADPSQWVWFHRRWRTKQKKPSSDVLHGERV